MNNLTDSQKSEAIKRLIGNILGIDDNTPCQCENCTEAREKGLGEVPQEAFRGAPLFFKWAAADKDGELWLYEKKPVLRGSYWAVENLHDDKAALIGRINIPNFEESLTERVIDDSMKSGSEATAEMFLEGAKFVMCKVSDSSDEDAIAKSEVSLVTSYDGNVFRSKTGLGWKFAVTVDTQGNPVDFNI